MSLVVFNGAKLIVEHGHEILLQRNKLFDVEC